MLRILPLVLVVLAGCRSAPEPRRGGRCGEVLADGGPLEFFQSLDGGAPIRLTGHLAQEQILGELKGHRAEFRACLDATLARGARPSGKQRVSFLIAPDGSVPVADTSEVTFDDENLAACVVEVVRALTFPRPDCGGPVLFAHTFVFMLESEAAVADAGGF